MQISLGVDRASAQSLQQQIFDGIRELILSGRLMPGAPVPSSRELAEELLVSRNTVVIAYDSLINEGFLKTLPAGRTYVNEDLPKEAFVYLRSSSVRAKKERHRIARMPEVDLQWPELKFVTHSRPEINIDFWGTRTNPESFPIKIWRRSLAKVIWRASTALTEYGDPAGLPQLRQAIAKYLGPARGIRPDPDQIVIVNGAQEALNIVARLFVCENTPVATENPCFQGAARVFESYGGRLLAMPVDESGVQVEAIIHSPAKIVYLTPSHQFPTGYSLSLERRLRLLEWAAQTSSVLIEDDYDGDFCHVGSPIMALAGLDSYGSVIYLGTFSKSLGPGLRIGYMVVPKPLQKSAVAVKHLLDNGNSWLEQAVLTEFLDGGSYQQHLRRIRQTYRVRRDCLVNVLHEHFGDVHLSGLNGGMHIMWHLPDHFPTARALEQMAQAEGVGIYSLDSAPVFDYGNCPYTDRSVILGFSSLTEARIREGVKRIAQALKRPER